MEDKVLALLSSRIEERKKQLIESLAIGSSKDFADYRYMCGMIRGLSFAHSEITDLVRKLKEYQDE